MDGDILPYRNEMRKPLAGAWKIIGEIWYNIMMFKMSLLLDTIQQARDVEIWYNIMQFKMSLLLDKIQLANDVEIWYNIRI